MSWFTELAGKAESLLNNIDQSAAGAIKHNETLVPSINMTPSNPTPLTSKGMKGESDPPIVLSKHSKANMDGTKSSSCSPSSDQKPSRKSSYTKLHSAKAKSRTSTPKDQDAALFDFLNSNEEPSTPRSSRVRKSLIQKSTSTTSVASIASQSSNYRKQSEISEPRDHLKDPETNRGTLSRASFEISRSSSIDSMVSKTATNKATNDNGSHSSEGNEHISEADVISCPLDTASESEFEMVSNTAVSSTVASDRESGEEAIDVFDKGTIVNLQMENRMLQNEITALHQEMKSLSERNIRAKAEMDKQLGIMQRKNDDLSQEHNVQNSQVQAMRIQINDMENENKSLMRSINSLKTERERIIDDQTAGTDMHAQAMEQLRFRAEEAESSLIREKDFNSIFKEEVLREKENQETETRKLAEALRKSDVEKQTQKKRLEDMAKEIILLQTSLVANKSELSDYKQKASRILQSKERLITSLKGGSEADLTAAAAASIELEELHQERDSMKEELVTSRSELLQMKQEYQDMEGHYQQENSALQEEMERLRRSLDDEMRAKREAETDASKYEKEVRREREEATRTRAAANERLQDKEDEIGKLRSQLMMRSRTSPDEAELESRLHQLTETLLQKQTVVETLTAEKSSLVLQLEKAEGQIKRMSQESSTRLQMPTSDGGENLGMHYRSNVNSSMFELSDGPDHGVVGQVRKAASAVDRFSVRLGVFLRRYPTARLFVIVYMGLLHLWVMIVLLTYTPEVHGSDYHSINTANGVPPRPEHQVDHGLPKAS